MKYAKYLLYLILIIVLVFFGRGFLTPSVSYESEVLVDKSIEESWAVMSDESRMSEWIKEIKKVENVSGTPNTVGAVSKIYMDNSGEDYILEETITSIKPNEQIAMTFSMDFMKMDYEMLLSEREGKTHILTKSNTFGNGIFAKSILSFMTKPMKKEEDKNLNNLKIMIEENTIDYFPVLEVDSLNEN